MINNLPAVTVIIPTYNREHVIRRALHSVIYQTYQNLEIIVVDDGSTDNTENVVKSLADPRIHYLRHDTRQGAAAARNTGIKAAAADYIAFQDSDDEWLCEKLEKQMGIFTQAGSEIGVVYTGFVRFDGRNTSYYPPDIISKKSGDILGILLNGNFVTTQAAVVKKDCFIKAGMFDEQLPRLQDWELFIRIAKNYKFICIDEPLLIAFHSPGSITDDCDLFPAAFKIILERHRDLFSKHKHILAKHCYMLGRLASESGNLSEGRKYFWASLCAEPLHIKHLIRISATILGPRIYRTISKILNKVNNAGL